MKKDRYENPLCSRYASERMQQIFSPDYKFTTWHRLWLSLAENERALGLPVTAEQVAELRENLAVIDYEAAERYEKELRHDVMAHIRAWGEHCPRARGIIHLGATSCFVDDNGDLIAYRDAMEQIRGLLLNVIEALADFIRDLIEHKQIAELFGEFVYTYQHMSLILCPHLVPRFFRLFLCHGLGVCDDASRLRLFQR